MPPDQPKLPLPPATWQTYRENAAALLAMMTPEGRERALAFWKLNTPKPPTGRK